jgi:hypothetical protein
MKTKMIEKLLTRYKYEGSEWIARISARNTLKSVKEVIKEEQKELAKQIREMKNSRKKTRYGYVDGLDYTSEEYRHRHIAYCRLFNGTPYDLIESNPDVPVEEKFYSGYISEWSSLIVKAYREVSCNENVHTSA